MFSTHLSNEGLELSIIKQMSVVQSLGTVLVTSTLSSVVQNAINTTDLVD